jgi:adenylate cyclase
MNAILYFWAELKRRNVFRAGLAWLALSWLSIEIAARLFPALALPEMAIRWLIIGCGLAVLPVMLFAWLFQLTPEGLRRDRGPQTETPENARSARRTDQLIIVLLLLALASSAVSRFVLPHRAAPVPEAAAPVERGPLRPMAPAGPVDPRSVAVLPFDNLDPDGGEEWFALGMAEELLNVLARVEGLRVSSRTSSFAFQGSTLGTREIARRLGVAHVVDGSVHRVGDRIRINTQLTAAADDTLLWTARYEREFSDVFTLQEEIAQAVADALAESLGVRQVRVQPATADLEAYELYLRGRQLFAQRGSALPGARRLLTEAVERDPDFARAWATLAGAWYVSPSYSQDIDAREALRMASESAARALALDPNEATALAVQARLAAEAGDRLAAASLIQRAPRARAQRRQHLGLAGPGATRGRAAARGAGEFRARPGARSAQRPDRWLAWRHHRAAGRRAGRQRAAARGAWSRLGGAGAVLAAQAGARGRARGGGESQIPGLGARGSPHSRCVAARAPGARAGVPGPRGA